MDMAFATLRSATAPLWSEPLALLVLVGFLLWAGIFDIKTFTITNRFNRAFLVTGLALMGLHFMESWLGYPSWLPSLSIGWSNVWGAVVGFLVLFVPAFLKNHPMGGDIKIMTIIGLWLGLPATLVVLMASVFLNALIAIGGQLLRAHFTQTTPTPFAAFLVAGTLIVYGAGWFLQ